MALLYTVYYYGRAMDSDVPLPKAAPEIECAANTNWDGHTLRPVRMADGAWDWTCRVVTYDLLAPSGTDPVSSEAQRAARTAIDAMRLIEWTQTWTWTMVATLTMRIEDESDNRKVLAEGWKLKGSADGGT